MGSLLQTAANTRARIVVIDDTPELLEFASIVLSSFGHTVFKASNGRDGLKLARRERPHLVIVDVEMPDMNGLEVLRLARADLHLAHVPIVALTACAMHGDRERLLAAGFTGYISKPIRARELLPMIEPFLFRPQPATVTGG